MWIIEITVALAQRFDPGYGAFKFNCRAIAGR